ncbi:hypothetical protein C8R47DRAFT_1077260 [Mycena vitilis]|nr:hypothetical protein C8R47DRAFT_1077260 [Mycena vitilis]
MAGGARLEMVKLEFCDRGCIGGPGAGTEERRVLATWTLTRGIAKACPGRHIGHHISTATDTAHVVALSWWHLLTCGPDVHVDPAANLKAQQTGFTELGPSAARPNCGYQNVVRPCVAAVPVNCFKLSATVELSSTSALPLPLNSTPGRKPAMHHVANRRSTSLLISCRLRTSIDTALRTVDQSTHIAIDCEAWHRLILASLSAIRVPTNPHLPRPTSKPMRPKLSSPTQDTEKNDANSNEKSIVTRLAAWIFPPRSKTVKPEGQTQKGLPAPRPMHETPKYSEAESRQASANLWSIYISEAERYDRALVESWKADMEGMLIFVRALVSRLRNPADLISQSGLFSASLTAFLVESYRTLQPDSGTMSVQLLTQISQQLASNSTEALATSEILSFHPAPSSLICNALWFISLSLSITCALLATLIEQWAREFLHRTERKPSPIQRAQIFSFLYFGVRRFGMHSMVDVIPLLLHVSLMLFLAGLVAFLLPINHIIMGLIAAILAGFLAVYGILTVLPVLSLDSPYRTPFSNLVWRLFHKLPSSLLSRSTYLSASPSTMDDAMVEMALQPSEIRDQRALSWTLDSLTDNIEFLPFLESIPEAIYGFAGFHHRNGYLFVHLLDNPANPHMIDSPPADSHSLSERITDFLLSCRNMASDDPLRKRRLIAGMKAVWALGMISDGNYHRKWSGGGNWFTQRTSEAISTFMQTPDNYWPTSYESSAQTGINYSRINNLRSFIVGVSNIDNRDKLLEGVQNINRMALAVRMESHILWTHNESLEAWTRDSRKMQRITDVHHVLEALVKDAPWIEASVSLAAEYLLRAAEQVHMGGPPAFEYAQTCVRMVPWSMLDKKIPFDQRMDRSLTLSDPGLSKIFDPSLNASLPGKISDLDGIMRSLIRLIPHIRPGDLNLVLPVYFGRHSNLEVLGWVVEESNMEQLREFLVAMLEPGGSTPRQDDLLHAVSTIFAIGRYKQYWVRWTKSDDQLWDYMAETETFATPAFSSLCRVMTMRKYDDLFLSASTLRDVGELQKLSKHPLLPDEPEPTHENITSQVLAADIRSRAIEAKVAVITDYLADCIGEVKPMHMSATVNTLLYLLKHWLTRVDTQVYSHFARAWVAIMHHLLDNPTATDMVGVFQRLLRWTSGAVESLYHPAVAPIFEKAFLLYLDFLEAHPGHRGEVQTKKILTDLRKLMAAASDPKLG